MSQKLKYWSAGLSATVVLAFLVFHTIDTSHQKDHHFVILMSELKRLDAVLNLDIARLRSGHLSNYDSFVNINRQLTSGLARTKQFLVELTGVENHETARHLGEIGIVHENRERQLQRLVSLIAIQRNSLRYLPVIAAELKQRTEKGRHEKLGELLQELLRDTLLFSLHGDKEKQVAIASLLARLDRISPTQNLDIRAKLEILSKHTRIVADTTSEVDRSVRTLLAVGFSGRLDTLRDAYLVEYHRTRRNLPYFQVALGLYALFLLVALAFIFIRLARARQELAQANLTLEERIEERTTELHERTKQLQKSEGMLRSIFDTAGIGIFVRNIQDRTLIANDAACDLFGYSREELEAIRINELIHPGDPTEDGRLHAQLAAGEIDSYHIDKRFVRKDGKPVWVHNDQSSIRDEQDNVLYTISIFQDRTRQKLAEEQLRQAQKMDSIGTLAGGVAHELNNMLFPIQGMTEMTLMELEENSVAYKNLSVVLKSAERASELVEKILSFSHQDSAERKPVVLGDVIEEELALLRSTLPATIKIRKEIDDSPVTAIADETQIHQILMNLASNAAHAMGGKTGELTIGLSATDLRDRTECVRLGIEPGSYAKLTVRDTGHGMDKETVERIFDPFFTTKEVGEGTGLGLAMIHGIITTHGGGIDVASQPGAGTAFHIYLPLAGNAEPAEAVNG